MVFIAVFIWWNCKVQVNYMLWRQWKSQWCWTVTRYEYIRELLFDCLKIPSHFLSIWNHCNKREYFFQNPFDLCVCQINPDDLYWVYKKVFGFMIMWLRICCSNSTSSPCKSKVGLRLSIQDPSGRCVIYQEKKGLESVAFSCIWKFHECH